MAKTLGYLISTLSVLLLGVVSWESARGDTALLACLVGGVAASVAGMFLRWRAYRQEVSERSQAFHARPATTPAPRGSTRDVPPDAADFGAGR